MCLFLNKRPTMMCLAKKKKNKKKKEEDEEERSRLVLQATPTPTPHRRQDAPRVAIYTPTSRRLLLPGPGIRKHKDRLHDDPISTPSPLSHTF